MIECAAPRFTILAIVALEHPVAPWIADHDAPPRSPGDSNSLSIGVCERS